MATTKSLELNPHNYRVLLPPEIFLNVAEAIPVSAQTDLLDSLRKSVPTLDPSLVSKLQLKSKENLLYHEDKVFVPDHLVRNVISSRHDPISFGHPGIKKTTTLVEDIYWWPTLRKDTEEYVRGCTTCQQTKPMFGKPYGLLKPLPVPNRPWQHIACDFVGPLPLSNGYTMVLTIVDRFTKMAVFVPCTKYVTSYEFARLFVKHVYCRFGLPSTLVTDRGTQFTAQVWQCLAGLLGVAHRLSTAYHPQTDGQSETVNKVLGHFLRTFTNIEQNNWSDLLPHAEFCYNTTPHSTTGVTPLMALTGSDVRKSLDDAPAHPKVMAPDAVKLAKHMKKLHNALYTAINDANERYAATYNRKRREKHFQVGDWVWLNNKNLRTLRPSKKLDNRFSGPYQIERVVNDLAYTLKMEAHTSLGRTFHVDLLKPYVGDLPLQEDDAEPPNDFSYGSTVPLEILSHRTVRGTPQWRVRWSTKEVSWVQNDTMTEFPEWPKLRDAFVPPKRPRKQKPENATPWKGWVYASSEPSVSEDPALEVIQQRTRLQRRQAQDTA